MRHSLVSLIALSLSLVPLTAKETPKEPECICGAKQISKVFTTVAKEATQAVLYIRAEGGEEEQEEKIQGHGDPFSDDFFNRFFGMPYNKKAPPLPSVSQGSGFFVSEDGYILTNAHLVKKATKVTIVFNDGREMPATIIGIDASTDVAVIKVEGKGFPFLQLGNSDAMEIGEWVMAIGSPFQLQASVTVGVISAKGRQNLRITDFEDFIQTDAAINPGNSGGPLLNLEGEAIGINTAIVSKSGGYIGISFAIPSNMAKHIMKQIIENGSVTRGFLGVSLQPLDQDMADAFNLEKPEGALVAEVVKGSAADKAGLKQGDIIIQYNNVPVKSVGSLRNDISLIKPGTKVVLKVNRNGKLITIPVTLGSGNENGAGSSFIQKLGMEVEPLSPELAKKLGYSDDQDGVVVTKIKPGSAAALAGIRPGFIIVAVNQKKVTTMQEFQQALEEVRKGRLLILAKQGNVSKFYSIKVE